MTFDYSKLKGKIVEKFGTNKEFAKAMNLSEPAISSKLKSGASFFQSQIILACSLLDIQNDEIGEYFFNENVQKK
ncbi:DUF739 family protein [Aerococcaceae bacterium zg-B36]|uniref:DUF739 family protein n=1 Tax=Aerococcaceae bacterium zg-252 TaxID=2796928 RepID=UPI001BD8247A|nr:DUF739 family protein [Aerococcaceae bacterium zg-B36]